MGNGQRASYEVFVLLAVATLPFHLYSKPVKTTLATCWIATILYLLLGSHDVLFHTRRLIPLDLKLSPQLSGEGLAGVAHASRPRR